MLGALKNGWNTLVFDDLTEIKAILNNSTGEHESNLYGTGNASKEIFEIIEKFL